MKYSRRLMMVAGSVAVALVGAEAGALHYYRSANRRADLRWRKAEKELDRVRQSRPAPTEASASALARDAQELRRTVAALEGAFVCVDATPDSVAPQRSADIFFEVGAMVEATTARARALNVALARDTAGWGFSAYAKEGPEPARGAAVRRQLAIGRTLIDALLASRPQAILSVQRQVPPTDAERQARHATPKRGDRLNPSEPRMPARENADYFVFDPRWSVFAAGAVDAMAFRLVFVADTGAMRAFIAALSSGSSALVIRSIEVEPAPATSAEAVKPANQAWPSSILLQEDTPAPRPAATPVSRASKFSIVVEHVEIILPVRSDEGKSGT